MPFKAEYYSHVNPKACVLFQPFIKEAHKLAIRY